MTPCVSVWHSAFSGASASFVAVNFHSRKKNTRSYTTTTAATSSLVLIYRFYISLLWWLGFSCLKVYTGFRKVVTQETLIFVSFLNVVFELVISGKM